MSSGYLRHPHIHGDLLTFTAGDDVRLAPAAGGRAWPLSADDVPVSYPRFSRDGSRAAWTSWRDGNPEVYSAEVGGSAAARLTYWGDPQTRVTGWTAAGEVLAITAANQPAAKYRRAPGRCWPGRRASQWSSRSGLPQRIPRPGAEWSSCRCARTGGCATRTGWPGGAGRSAN